MTEFFRQLLDWIQRVLPSALSFMAIGYKWGTSKVRALTMKNIDLTLENAKLKNEKAVHDAFDGLTDAEVIDRVLSSPDPTKLSAGSKDPKSQ